MRNSNFICPRCGRADDVPSVMVMQANYGSSYDTERVTVELCGECFDEIYEYVQKQIPAHALNKEFSL